jgi:hypothetical protein
VANPGPGVVVVGMSWLGGPAWPGVIGRLTATSIVRRARLWERRRPDRGAVTVLGAVPPGTEGRWSIEAPWNATCCRVVLGTTGGRLRIYEHRTSRRARDIRAIPNFVGRRLHHLSLDPGERR